MTKKLYRSMEDRILCGVCGGIAEYLNIDPTVIRLAWALFSVFTAMFGGIIAYIIACMIIPERL
ncbi:PspC domain-containing protein [Clostridium sp. Cult3]|uniref:PspC domain-containing protein n=1 Tax=Clostridium sp. Cult3 TaxID=2079004 RepID=UPI001F2E7EE3|nr:PspC domain-containing protein [Clostridium sp. Cult3]MCF6460694.1 PspC domain-containing protein [Clostridium sp. Cult3]